MGACELCPGPSAGMEELDKIRTMHDGSKRGEPMQCDQHDGEDDSHAAVDHPLPVSTDGHGLERSFIVENSLDLESL